MIKSSVNRAGVDMDKRTIRGFFSTPDMDADLTIIDPMGINTDRYLINPVVLKDHDNKTESVMGRTIELKKLPEGLYGTMQLTAKPEGYQGNWMQDTLLYMYWTGDIRAFSICFDELSARRPTPEERKMFPKLKGVYESVELAEISLVAVPSNPMTVSDKYMKWFEAGKPMDLETIKKDFKPKTKITIVDLTSKKEIIKKMVLKEINSIKHKGKLFYG